MERRKEDPDNLETGLEISRKKFFPRLIKSGMALWEIAIEGGGGIPNELKGQYTSLKKALNAIDTYWQQQEYIKENKRPYHWSRANAAKNKARNQHIQ